MAVWRRFWDRRKGRVEPDYTALRERMVTQQIAARHISDAGVLSAMRAVPRHLFVPPQWRPHAYEDRPLPIGTGQTISQPYIVAYMLQAMTLHGVEHVLEIGTGSGYQTALLCHLAGWVTSLERHAALAEGATDILDALGLTNREIVVTDGSFGDPAHAPFDAITVGAVAPRIPPPLVDQLAEGGRLVLPIAEPGTKRQFLIRVWRGEGGTRSENLGEVVFVPLVGRYGYAPPSPTEND